MEKIVVPPRFNKTGRRVLQIPLDESKICAPAYQLYRKARFRAQEEWKLKCESLIRKYVERMADWIASYVARDSTPATEKYKVAKFLAEQSLTEREPMNTTGPGSSERWSIQLGDMEELSVAEEEAWEDYVAASNKAEMERDTAIAQATSDCDEVKRALRQEVSALLRD